MGVVIDGDGRAVRGWGVTILMSDMVERESGRVVSGDRGVLDVMDG